MNRTIFTLAVALFSSGLSATERIYLRTSYDDIGGISGQHNMVCRDSRCTIHSQSADRSMTLSKAQWEQILEAFQMEANRFDIKNAPQPGENLLSIKLKYTTERKRLEITRRIPVDQPADVSPELTAVIKTYLELDLSRLGSPAPAAGEENPEPADPQQN